MPLTFQFRFLFFSDAIVNLISVNGELILTCCMLCEGTLEIMVILNETVYLGKVDSGGMINFISCTKNEKLL